MRDFALVHDFASACVFTMRCGEEFEDGRFKGVEGGIESEGIEGIEGGIAFEGIEGGVGGGVGGRIGEGAIGVGMVGGIVVGIVGGGSPDRGVGVLVAKSITGFSHSRYRIPRIIDCAPSGATKKVPW